MRTWFKVNVLSKPIGWLLSKANASPPVMARTEFYALKVRLCQQFGMWERAELQHVVKKCWDCEGTGTRMRDYLTPHTHTWVQVVSGPCHSCNWTGVYREFWGRLERWNVGGFIFHEPKLRYDRKPEWGGAEIEGLIEHERPRWMLHKEAHLWLTLFFDRQGFWRCFLGSSSAHGKLPLLLVQRLVWNVRRWREAKIGQRICRWFNLDGGIPF